MNDQLEADLREVFSRRIAALPRDIGVRLRAMDYHPRSSRISTKVTVGALGGAAATAGVVVTVVLGGTQAAFAGWTAAPTPASSGQTATAETNCRSDLANLAAPGQAATSGWDVVMSDVRGPFSLYIYQAGGDNATCFTGSYFTLVSSNSADTHGGSVSMSGSSSGVLRGAGSTSYMVSAGGSGDIGHLSVAHLDLNTAGGGPYTLVEGQIAAQVSALTLVRSDGSDVQASVENGWFAAWWPGTEDATSAQVTTPSGTASQPLTTPVPPGPPGGVNATTCPTVGSGGTASSSSPSCGGQSTGPGTGAGGGSPSLQTQGTRSSAGSPTAGSSPAAGSSPRAGS